MDHIAAADNYAAQMTNDRWRLLINDRPTAEITQIGLRYGGKFAHTRRLPPTGIVERGQIAHVVLGWQQADEAWHLGLILAPQLAQSRGSRWCELMRWPDPDITVFQDLSRQAGMHLAQVLKVPFHVVPPRRAESRSAPPPRPLPEPPLSFGWWTLERAPSDKRRFVISLSPRWKLRKYGRIAWHLFWAAAYFWLSWATLTSPIALPNAGTLLPNPEWLPYLGIGIAGFLILLVIVQILRVGRQPSHIIVDGVEGRISAWKNKRLRWQVSAADVQSVYVSEVVKKRSNPPATEYGELNLHLGGGNFAFVVKHHEPEDNDDVPQPKIKPKRNSTHIASLTRENAYTALQMTGLYVAETLDLPVWYDVRVK